MKKKEASLMDYETPFMRYLRENPMILPTGGAARNYSALTTETFQKISYEIHFVGGKTLEKLAPGIKLLTRMEGLTNHWKTIECRLRDYRKSLRKEVKK